MNVGSQNRLEMKVLKKDLTKEVVESSFRRQFESLDSSQRAIIGDPESFIAKFLKRKEIKDLIQKSRTNKELIQAIDKSGATELEKQMFSKFMKDAELEFDGNAIFNRKYFEYAKREMRQNVKNLRESINSGTLSKIEQQNAQVRLLELTEQLSMVQDAENLYQVTGRGFTDDGLIKVAYDIRDLGKGFENIYQIIGASGKKSEIGLAKGLEFIQMSGFGIPKSQVYADPVTVAFHPDLYSSPEDIEKMTQYSAEVMQDFKNAIETNTIPEKVRTMMQQTLLEDSSNLPASIRLSKDRNRDFIRRIFELHQSGIGPKSSPEMMNLLANVFASEAFTMRMSSAGVERYYPVVPGVQRYALASEVLEGLPGGNKGNRTVNGIEKTIFKLADDTEVTADLLKFRVSGHKMLFGPGMIPEFFNALGGFDLDDKGLFKLESFMGEGGKQKLLFGITRQPSGVDEVIYGRARLDDLETIRSIFGQNEKFMAQLEEIIDTKSGKINRHEAEVLRALISGKVPEGLRGAYGKKGLNEYLSDIGAKKTNQITEEYVENLIFKVYEASGRTIKKATSQTLQDIATSGASALRNTDLYKRSEIYKLFKEEGAFDVAPISDEALSILDQHKSTLGPSMSSRIKEILNMTDGEARNNAFVDFIKDNSDNKALNAFASHSIFNKMLSSAGADGNFLGVYVNRSMVVGSSLKQLDGFLAELMKIGGGSGELKQFMKYGIGLLSSEEAIDSTINFGSNKFALAPVRDQLNRISSLLEGGVTNVAAAQKAALKALGYGDAANVTLDLVGETAIERLGMRIGSGAAIVRSSKYAGKFSEDLFLGIDEILLEDRLSSQDVERFIKGIKQGINDTIAAGSLEGEEITKLKKTLDSMGQDYDVQRNTVLQIFGLNEKHKYASLAKVNATAARVQAEFDIMRRLSLAGITEDAALSSLQVSDNARKAAEYIVRRNVEEFNELMSVDLSKLENIDTYNNKAQKLRLGRIVENEIKDASKATGVSLTEMINAVEKVSAEMRSGRGRRFDISRLLYMPEEGSEKTFLSMIGAATVSRQAQFFSSQVSSNVTQAVSEYGLRRDAEVRRLLDEGDVINEERISKKVLKQMIDDTTGLSEEVRNIASVMAGRDLELDAERVRQINREAGIARSQIAEQVYQSDIALGQAAYSGDTTTGKSFREGLDLALDGEDYSAFTKTKFTRFSDYIKSGRLKELFSENKLFRNSIYGATALIAASFAYQGFKDRTEDSIKGPPLLPGGSAYESQYPQRAPEIPQLGTISYNPGMSYKVNLYGNRGAVRNFEDMAIGLGNFDMDTTIYSGIPEVGRDPYQQLASSF